MFSGRRGLNQITTVNILHTLAIFDDLTLILCATRSRLLLMAWRMSFLPCVYGQTVAL